MSEFVLPVVAIVDESMRRNERVLHNGLLAHLEETYPNTRIDSEPYWGPGVGRPDIVCYTYLPAELGLMLTIIEVKRPLADDNAYNQLARYYLHASRWMKRTATPGSVTGILAAPDLRLDQKKLNDAVFFLPLSVTYR